MWDTAGVRGGGEAGLERPSIVSEMMRMARLRMLALVMRGSVTESLLLEVLLEEDADEREVEDVWLCELHISF